MAKRRRRSVKSWKNKSKKLFRTLKQWGMGGMVLALVVSALYMALAWTARLGLDWLPVLAGWPVLLSWVGVFLYGCRHPFH